jgi:hypothetical protein
MNSPRQYCLLKRLGLPFLWCIFSLIAFSAKAQERPPRPVTVRVSTAQHLQFGSFIQTGSSGTVSVDYTGTRTATGSVILPNISSSAFPTPALFIVDAEPGTLITILNGPDAILTGSNTGTMTLKIGDASTRSPFVTRSQYTDVFIGGTLIVGPLSANPAGSYSGTFTVTFIQE